MIFLAGVPIKTIQLIGRWQSQTNMRYYVRIHIQQMTKGVADVMTANPDFFTIEGVEARTDLRKSCGLHHKPGQQQSELENWRPGIEGEGNNSGERSVV